MKFYRGSISDPWDKDRADNAYSYRKPTTSSCSCCWTSFMDFILSKNEPLRNKKGQFSVLLNTRNTSQVITLLSQAEFLGLTVSGDESAKRSHKRLHVEDLEIGDFVVFGDENSRFDVDFVRKTSYIKDNNLVPIYELEGDEEKIIKAMQEMAEEKQDLMKKAGNPEEPTYAMLKGTYKGSKKEKKENKSRIVTISDNWISYGGTLYPKYQNDNVVCIY